MVPTGDSFIVALVLKQNNLQGGVLKSIKKIATLVTIAFVAVHASTPAGATERVIAATVSTKETTTEKLSPAQEAYLEIIDQELAWFENASPADVKAAHLEASRQSEERAIPLPGPTAIVGCVLTAAWVFRGGYDPNGVYMQLAEVVIGCVGIPVGSWATVQVAKQIWKYRQKIAAALGVIGISAAHLAPFINAPEPR